MNILFEQVAERKSKGETALYASMLMPHLVLAGTRTDREQSIGETRKATACLAQVRFRSTIHRSKGAAATRTYKNQERRSTRF